MGLTVVGNLVQVDGRTVTKTQIEVLRYAQVAGVFVREPCMSPRDMMCLVALGCLTVYGTSVRQYRITALGHDVSHA